MSDDRASDITRPLGPIISARLAGNLLLRFPYSFVTAISRGLGIHLATTTALLGVRELGGLASPGIGAVADRGHERRAMVTCAALAGVSTVLIAGRPALWLVTILLVLGGIAKFGSDTAQTAWIGHRAPFEARARIFGVVELSWSLAFVAGVPVCAWLLHRWGWQAMFLFSGGFLLVSGFATQLGVPRDRPETVEPGGRVRMTGPLLGMYAYVALQPFAQMFVFAVYGDWFVKHLHMSDARLGFSTLLIGVGEGVGTGLTALVTHRVGPRRAAIAGMVLAAPLSLLIGTVGGHVWYGVVLLVVMSIGVEFSFVSALPIITELDPTARAAAIGLATVFITIARAASSAISGEVYVHLGMATVGVVGGISFALAGVALWRVVEPASAGTTRT